MKYLLIAAVLISAVAAAEEYTIQDVHDAYSRIFTIEVEEYDGGVGYSQKINKLDKDDWMAGLVNENRIFFDFLLVNMHDSHNDSLISYYKKGEIGKRYETVIGRDTAFDKLLLTMVDNYLGSRGDKIADFKGIKSYKIDMDEVVAKAVRFFFLIKKGDPEEVYRTICIGNHGLWELGDRRDYAVEAFCYAALRNDLSKWMRRLGKAHETAAKLTCCDDKETDFNRCQGAIWMQMAHDPELREALAEEYEGTRHFLPFEIKGL